MKRSFIRALWGNVFSEQERADRGKKVTHDIMQALSPKDSFPFVIYTFGEYNHKCLKELGFNSILVSKETSKWDMQTELYRHKLEVFKLAMDDFDEIVYLDWDCVPIGKIPVDFWSILNKKEIIQANLFQYRTKKCLWREGEQRKVMNGGFVYIRDNSVPSKLIKNWDEFKAWTGVQKGKRDKKGLDLRFREKALTFDDEPAMSKFTDDYIGGWQGAEKYWDLFEPEVCILRKKSVYTEEMNKSKNACFKHLL